MFPYRTSTPLRAFALAIALLLGSRFAQAQTPAFDCNVGGVPNVKVQLLPAISNSEARRERIHISSALARDLGIGTKASSFLRFNPTGEVNPQIRVVITSPVIDDRISTATFTVAGIFDSAFYRIKVYGNLEVGEGEGEDKDSGEFKLFKDAPEGDPEDPDFDVDPDATDANGDIANVSARVFWTPAATSTLTRRNSAAVPSNPGTTTESRIFCEPNDDNDQNFHDAVGFYETGIIETNKRFALAVPHGGDVEVKTSDQISTVLDRLRTAFAVHGSLWEGNGSWGLEQTRERWHITATALFPRSYPALDALFAEADFAPAEPAQPGRLARPARPVQYALALHGFLGSVKGLILGGQADREAKCLVALRIQDELQASRGNRLELAFRIFDPEGDIEVENSDLQVPPVDHDGLSVNNIVNRLSPNPNGEAGWGGIQIEQSSSVRTDQTDGQGGSGSAVRNSWLRHVVARGAANAIGELITASSLPTDACTQLQGGN